VSFTTAYDPLKNKHLKILKLLLWIMDLQISNPIKVISVSRNSGFSEGNRLGFLQSCRQFIALLNNDTEPAEDWLKQLVSAIQKNPDVGICASKLIAYENGIIDSAGDRFTMLLKGDKRGEGQSASWYVSEEHVFGACAGAALYRRKMFDEIGFFDEDFFLIHEDTDLNFRAQLAGWKVLYVPSAIVQHKVRSTIGEMSDLAIYYSVRNSELVRIKNVPLSIFVRCLPWSIISEISEFIYFALKHKRFSLYFKAKMDALKLFPSMLKKRKQIMKNKKVSNKYIMSIITPMWEKDFFMSKLRKFIRG
jgi:GT2 family glycosyltransferase